MAFKEQKAYDNFSADSVGVLKLYRVENMIGSAMPDVIGENRKGAAFWLELKALHEWPKRATTCPLKGKFEKGQLGWLRAWVSWNGRAYVLLRVGVDFYLLDPRNALDELPTSQLIESALVTGKATIIKFLSELA